MDDTDILLLLSLLERPDATNKELAATINVSEATLSRRYKKLQQRSILLGKSLQINTLQLGLKSYQIIIIPTTPIAKNLLLFQLFFKNHSYTSYQNQMYGYQNGLYIHLNLPNKKEAYSLLHKFLQKLKDKKLISQYMLFEPSYLPLVHRIDTTKYDVEAREFKMDYSVIRQLIHADIEDTGKLHQYKGTPYSVDEKDIKIIRELFLDASRSLSSIGAAAGGISKQDVSRRMLNMDINEWGYNIRYDREQFGVFNQTLFILDHDMNGLYALDEALNKYPFPASIYIGEDHIILWVNLHAVDVTQFTNILLERFSNVRLYLLSRKPLSYPPWENNLIDHTWRLDSEVIEKAWDENQLVGIETFFDRYRDHSVEWLEKRLYGNGN